MGNTYFCFKLQAAKAREVDWARLTLQAISTFRKPYHVSPGLACG